ncbi:unnamed protein product [Ambrosiozyma monospora]|uniref:Unnamed protein product n=1 Tax=Ambrosiozyma monospora TaxID=43982 RepID=A0A9W7DJ62_AMBMO|nr:unnamed protein product [Ambrosiozyma monospora]
MNTKTSSSTSNNPYMHDLFQNGSFSDAEVKAFDTSYKLHRILLMKSPYFKCLIDWKNEEKSSTDSILVNESCVLNVETDDPLITKESFELVLRRLYYIQDCEKEDEIPAQMIATAFFFQMDDIKEAMRTYWTGEKANMSFFMTALQMVSDHDYGEYGTSLRERCKEYLYDNGWQAGHEAWRDIKPSLIPELVNADEFFVPNEFERIMFAVKVLQDSKADDDEIDLAITKFREEFNFFTLTYGQQCVILDQKLANEKLIFDLSSFTNASLLTSHIQYSLMMNQSSQISTEYYQLPHSPKFKKYSYKIKNSRSEIINVSTLVPPFRLSIVLKPALFKELFNDGSYNRGFAYCGSIWRMSIYEYSKSDSSFKFAVAQLPNSYSTPLLKGYTKASSKDLPYFNQILKQQKEPNLPLANEIFESGANFHDCRDCAPVYYQIFFEYNSVTPELRGVSRGNLVTCPRLTEDIPDMRWTVHVPDYVHEIIMEGKPEKPIKLTFVIGVA